MDMNLGDTQLILATCQQAGVLRNQTAYLLATTYWETAHTMKPVEEAFWLSDDWRKRNLRYYPWHARGYVGLTWERNYVKAGLKINVNLVEDPTRAMDPANAAAILVFGSMEGWFTGKKIDDYITLQQSDYVGARRVINGTDKAHAIAEIAREYEAELLRTGYGVEPEVPIANTRRDGTAPRTSPVQSTTNIAATGGFVSVMSVLIDPIRTVAGQVTEAFGVSPEKALLVAAAACFVWVFRERIRKWYEGDR